MDAHKGLCLQYVALDICDTEFKTHNILFKHSAQRGSPRLRQNQLYKGELFRVRTLNYDVKVKLRMEKKGMELMKKKYSKGEILWAKPYTESGLDKSHNAYTPRRIKFAINSNNID